MIETTDDALLEGIMGRKRDEEIEYYGIGAFGENEKIKPLFKKFSLWK